MISRLEQITTQRGIFKKKYINLFENISYVALATFIEAASWFAFNVLTGRILGPEEYGKFTVVNSIGTLLYLPMIFGISTGMIKYASENRDFETQKSIISTSYILVTASTILFVIIYINLSQVLSTIFTISEGMFQLGINFSLFYVFYLITMSVLQGTHQLKSFALLKPVYSIIMLVSLLACTSIGHLSYKTPLVSMYAAYMISGIIAIWLTYEYANLKFNHQWAKVLTKYGSFTFLSAVSYILCTTIDKLLINKYLTASSVGLYNAYSISSMKIIGMFAGIFITALFPTISGYKDKSEILKKFNVLVPYIILFGVPIITITQYVTLKVYGEQFDLNFRLMIIFSVTSVLFVWYDTCGWIFNSIGIKGAKITMWGTTIIALTDILLDIYLIPILKLEGAIMATAISYAIGLCVIYIMKRSILN